jgi:hypothetical protein
MPETDSQSDLKMVMKILRAHDLHDVADVVEEHSASMAATAETIERLSRQNHELLARTNETLAKLDAILDHPRFPKTTSTSDPAPPASPRRAWHTMETAPN